MKQDCGGTPREAYGIGYLGEGYDYSQIEYATEADCEAFKEAERKGRGTGLCHRGQKDVLRGPFAGSGASRKSILVAVRAFGALLSACPYEEVSDDAFDSVAETVTPQGVLALVKMPEHTAAELSGSGKNLLLLETLQDPGNLGTILRTAEAAGIGGIILSADSVDAFSPKTVRATMGAVFRVPFVYVSDFAQTVLGLKENGYTVYAAHLQGSVPYDEPDYKGSCAVMIGNEGNGLSDEATALADVRIRIPMEGKAESLNAGVAAALMMYELRRH